MSQKAKAHIKRYHKHYIGTILSLVVLLLLFTWGVVMHYRPLISQRLKKQVYLATDSLYRIDYSDVHLNPLLGKFTLDSFRLIPDTEVYNHLKEIGSAPDALFEVFVGEFKLRHIHLWSLIRHRQVNIGVVKIEHPDITIFHQKSKEKTNKETIRNALIKLNSGALKSIKVDHIGLHNIHFSYKTNVKAPRKNISVSGMDLVFENIKIDSATLKDTTRFLFAKNVWFHLDQGDFYTQDSLYEVKVQNMGLSVNDKELSIKKIALLPNLSKKAFKKQFKYRKDIFKGNASGINIYGFNLENFNNNQLFLEKIAVDKFNLSIYLDRRLPLNPVEKPLPQDILRKIDKDIKIKEIALEEGDIIYKEFNPHSNLSGQVGFHQIRGTIKNITNDSVSLSKNAHCIADFHSLFMKKGALHTHFDFNLLNPDDVFSFQGTLQDFRTKTLNPATRPLGMIKVNSGRIHALHFKFKATNKHAQGKVKMEYDRLRIAILTKDKQANELKKKGLISLAANLLLIRESDMNLPEREQEAEVFYPRDRQRSIFSLMWKSLFRGVKDIVGVDKKMENKLESVVQNWKDKKAQAENETHKRSINFKEISQFLKKNF